VVDYLTSLPTRYKLRGFKMKHILKETFQGRLPDPILARKKKGFGVPVAEWLKGPLRPWVEELFSSASLKQHGVLSTPGVQRLWTDHLAGVRDNRKPLWSMVVLLLWMQENL
jgi:asparagine synthase (glutamine-hydrolysing)